MISHPIRGGGTRKIDPANEDQARKILVSLMKGLSPARLHFGWRVVDDVLNFLSRAVTDGGELSFEFALDSVINAKVLPKLRGEDSARSARSTPGLRGDPYNSRS